MDNGDPGTSSTGTWTVNTDPDQYQEDYLVANKSSANTYRWTPSLTGTRHVVSAWWVADNSHSNRAEYTIVHGGGTSVYTRSQKQRGGQWDFDEFGAFSDIQYVEVSAANGKVVADGMRFREPEPCDGFGFCYASASIQSGKATYFIHTDHLGTPRAVSDDTQSVVWRWDSTPFGEGAPDEDPEGDSIDFELNLRFPGQYYDAELGLHYNHFRDFDASTGRFIESDPIGLDGGNNSYEYALSNPIRIYDPYGLEPNKACIAACTVGGGLVGGGIGYVGGGLVGGGGGTLVAPGVGTVGGAIGGAEIGGAAGAIAGSAAGNAIGNAFCPDDEEDEERCEQLLATDTATCNGIARVRGAQAGARCHASATQRYAACLRGQPLPPLDTWNN
jgi:RHS repeat-associated protein